MTCFKTYSSFSSKEKERLIDSDHNGFSSTISARGVLAFLSFLGFMNLYAMRVNINVGVVAMTNWTGSGNRSDNQECMGVEDRMANTTFMRATASKRTGEFNWDERTQGHVLGSFFYGYVLSHVPGGWLSNRVGGKALFGMAILCSSVLTLLTPMMARSSVYLLIATRVLEGLVSGVTYPANQALWGQWAHKWERTKLSSFSTSGSILGTGITLPIAGLLCDSNFLGGWPSIFYVIGTLGCIWSAAWMLLIHNTPAEHPRISLKERKYIENSTGKPEVLRTPWRAILTSPEVIACAICQHCLEWMFFMLLAYMPTYLENIHHFDLKSNGLLSALPYLSMWVAINISGLFVDYIRAKRWMSTVMTRKVFTSIGIIVPSFLLMACGYAGCNRILVVVLLTLSMGIHALVYSGVLANNLDIAPRFAGVITGLTNGAGVLPGFMAPLLVGYLTNNNQTMEQWRKIFNITGAIGIFGSIIYNIFAKGEELPWAGIPEDRDKLKSVNSFHKTSQNDTQDHISDNCNNTILHNGEKKPVYFAVTTK